MGALHGIVLQLLQTAAAKPFARESDPSDFDYQAVSDAVQPRLNHIGLNTVLTKLQKGIYSNVLEAVNDIYSVWLCAYRYEHLSNKVKLTLFNQHQHLLIIFACLLLVFASFS